MNNDMLHHDEKTINKTFVVCFLVGYFGAVFWLSYASRGPFFNN